MNSIKVHTHMLKFFCLISGKTASIDSCLKLFYTIAVTTVFYLVCNSGADELPEKNLSCQIAEKF